MDMKYSSKALLLLILLALLLRFPWLYTTIEKDEGQFGYTAWRWASGDSLYIDLVDNKPPLLYLIYYTMIQLWGNSIIPVRIFNNLLFVVSIIFFFKFTERIFPRKIALFSTLFYIVFMNIPVFEGYLAMSEPLLIPFLIMSVYFFERYVSTRKLYFIFISSIFASISFMIKQQAGFIFLILISGLFIYKEKGKLRKIAFITFVPIVTTLAIFLLDSPLLLGLLQRTWRQLIKLPMGFSYGYQPFRYNFLILLEGSVLFLFSFIGLVKVLKSKKEKKDCLLISWLFFAALFTLIPPAYGHYYIFLIPPLAVFAGIGMAYMVNVRQDKKLFILLATVLLLITSILVIGHFPDSRLNGRYLWWGWSDLDSYDQQIRIAEFVKNTTSVEDKIFVSDWEPSIYWLSNRSPPYPRNFTSGGCKSENFFKDTSYAYSVLTAQEIVFLGNVKECNFSFSPFLLIEPQKIYKIGGAEIWYDLTCKDFDKTKMELDYYYLCKVLVEDEFHFCNDISDLYVREKCYFFSALKSDDPSVILDYRKNRLEYNKDMWYTKLARKLGEISLCGNVSESLKDYCKGTVLNDESYCDRISPKLLFEREMCYQIVNWKKNNFFNFDSCINITRLGYNHPVLQNFYCRLIQVELTKDVGVCDSLDREQHRIFCKAFGTGEEKLCYAMKELKSFNLCMAGTTLDPSYCEKYVADA